jgi:ABC-type polysaccharide/polyol phosphate transport system ATPase subunit
MMYGLVMLFCYGLSRRLMSESVIRVEGLGKKYVLGHQSEGRSQYKSLRDVVADGARSMFRRKERSVQDEFWALRDVDFEIRQGDRVGIIGRNGAGKSTLLKVLSRIVEPTTGRIGIRGRVASLLEVGTGFHPELSGRENIFLNGAILGMSRREIERKFDEIVAFAEVERFLDTPVKRYSSGMYVRLAFAVAAHLEPEILIVDEVLAVGDSKFQNKCLGKMQDISAEGGRTVIFVSHQIESIARLCNKGVFLEKGQTNGLENIEDVLQKYVCVGQVSNNATFQSQEGAHVTSASVSFTDSGIKIRACVINADSLNETILSFLVEDSSYRAVMSSDARYDPEFSKPIQIKSEDAWIEIEIKAPRLRSGDYYVSLYLGDLQKNSWLAERCLTFHVEDAINASYLNRHIGSVIPECSWASGQNKEYEVSSLSFSK